MQRIKREKFKKITLCDKVHKIFQNFYLKVKGVCLIRSHFSNVVMLAILESNSVNQINNEQDQLNSLEARETVSTSRQSELLLTGINVFICVGNLLQLVNVLNVSSVFST